MRKPLAELLAVGELAAYILTLPLLNIGGAYAASAVASPDLDLSSLGRVAIAGDFDSVSLYSYTGQNEDSFTTNGSQALLTRYPDGAFESLGRADASILAMCPFVLKDGSLAGVIVGGDFTSLGGAEAASIALFNPNTTEITALPGLSGAVNALYCDANSSTVYVGGNFMGGNSTNAMAWTTGWVNLPFQGFNGPVKSITKNSAGHIVFGGQFDGLGNMTTPTIPNSQVVNLGSGNITSSGTTTLAGYDTPSSIICKTGSEGGANNTWLLSNDTGGWWEGSYGFGFNPTMMRLYNTVQDGRGTKMFYFEELNSGGILTLEYTDSSGTNQTCSNRCPLQNNTDAQDFYFDPTVGMSSFRIYITEWYGDGGGLDGIEMFQNDIYSFAVTEFNEPKCDGVSTGSSSVASPNGTWETVAETPATVGGSDYLLANLTNSSQISDSTNVIFMPDLKQAGNYSIMLWTPGCIQDGSCKTRGRVNITASMTSGGVPVSTTLYQTNNYDKYDEIYNGPVDIASGSFRPEVTLTPASGQSAPLTIVAQKVRFSLVTTTGGLNGLYEYNPNEVSASTDFSNSSVDEAGAKLDAGAMINAVAVYDEVLYVAGNFSGTGISNFMSVQTNATAVSGGGLNGQVLVLYQNTSTLYLGGNFSNTADSSATGLHSIAMYSASDDKWTPLGAGVNNFVTSIVPLTLNITGGDAVECIAVSGNFTSVNAYSTYAAYDADGIAVWVPSKGNWLANVADYDVSLYGDLSSYTEVPNFEPLYAGEVIVDAIGESDAVELVGSGTPSLQSLGIDLSTASTSSSSNSSSAKIKRAASSTSSQNYTGVYTGFFYDSNNLNITVLGGSFSATATNGSTVYNLVFINDTDSKTISGLPSLASDSVIMTMDTQDTTLFAGGAVTGDGVNGLVVYDLATSNPASPLPPALGGDNVVVYAVAAQPSSSLVYVGGSFDTAGSLPCATLCYWDLSTSQWNTPGSGLTGTIRSMYWSSDTDLTIAGDLTFNGNATTMVIYNSKKTTFTEITGASSLPGPVTALAAGSDSSEYWVAGTATKNNSVYLSKYSGSTWTGVGGLGASTTIRGLTVMSLTSDHQSSSLVPSDEVVLISGNINVPKFGNASAVLFNGTTYQPFILTNTQDGGQGSLSGIFVQNTASLYNHSSHHLALGLIVLIGLAIALGLIFLLVCAGIMVERRRRKREGYFRMPAPGTDPRSQLERINPTSLFAGLGDNGKAPPKI